MSVLPENTFLGNLEIIEIYEYFDRPLLFACKNTADSIFVVLHESETDTSDTWIYLTVSVQRLNHIRSGAMDLYSAFKKAETGFVWRVRMNRNEIADVEIVAVSVFQLHDDQLPDAGEALNLNTPTLERRDSSVQRRAVQLQREYVEFSLDLLGQRRTEAPILVLSEIMQNLQNFLISIAHTISDLHKTSKTPTRDLMQKMELSLLDVSSGSFRLEMASSEQADMFGDTLVGDALQELNKIVVLGSDEEQLQTAFARYKASLPKEYLKLLKSIRSSRINEAHLRWASANGRNVGETSWSSSRVVSTIDVIENMVITQRNIIHATGRLTGAFTDREFEIQTDDKTYRGRIDRQVISIEDNEIINNARLGNRYDVELREEMTYRISTDETTSKYYLKNITEID